MFKAWKQRGLNKNTRRFIYHTEESGIVQTKYLDGMRLVTLEDGTIYEIPASDVQRIIRRNIRPKYAGSVKRIAFA